MITALNKDKKAFTAFENFSFDHRKEYIIWFREAKTELNRNRRLAHSIELLAAGNSRNWKYE